MIRKPEADCDGQNSNHCKINNTKMPQKGIKDNAGIVLANDHSLRAHALITDQVYGIQIRLSMIFCRNSSEEVTRKLGEK